MSQLDILNISSEEENLYRLLLVSGQLSIGELQFSLNKDHGSVKQLLDSLVGKGLVRVVPGIESRYTAILPVGSVKDELIASANKVHELGNNLDSRSKDVISSLSSQLDESISAFKTDLKGKKEQFIQSTVIVESSVENKSNEFKTGNSESIAALQSSFAEMKESVANSTEQHLTSKQEEAKSGIGKFSTDFKTSIQNIKSKQSEIRNQDVATLPEIDPEPLDNMSNSIKTSVSDIIQNVGSHIEDIDNKYSVLSSEVTTSFNNNLDRLSTLKDEFEGLVNSTLTELTDQASTVAKEQGDKLTELFTEVQGTLSSDQEVLKQGKWNVQDGLQGIDQIVEESANEVLKSGRELYNEIDENINSTVSMIEGQLSEFSSNVQASSNSSADSLKSVITSKTSELEKELEEMMNAFLTSAKEKFISISQQMEQGITENKKSIEEQLNVIVNQNVVQLRDNAQSFKNKGEQEIAQTENLVQESVSKVKESNLKLLEKINAEIDSQIIKSEDNSSKFEENINRINQELHDLYLKEEAAFNQLRETQALRIKEVFMDVVASVREEVNNKMNAVIQDSLNYKNEALSKMSEIKSNLDQKVAENKKLYSDTLGSMKAELQNRITDSISVILSSSEEAVSQLGTQSDDLISQLNNQLSTLSNELQLVIQTTLEGFEDSFNSLADQARTMAETLVSGVMSEFSSLLDNSGAVVKSSYDSLEELSNQGNQKILLEVEQALNNFLNDFRESTSVVSKDATALATVLDTVYSLQQNTKTSEAATTHIIGTEANIAHISEIISRIKSKATILVPEVGMVDVESILNLPRTAQVTIISYINEIDHREWIEKMHGADANITLRSLSKSGIGSALPDFIGCEREGEEILLAAKDEKAKTYIGIASLSEDFVRILGNIVIADYARGRSKQLQK